MKRLHLLLGVVLIVAANIAPAQEPKAKQGQAQRGTLKAIDAEKGLVTITADGKDREFSVVPQTQIQDLSGQPAKDGLKDPGFKPGAPVMFRARQQDGK